MRGGTQGGQDTFPLFNYAQQKDADRTGAEEEIQQVPRQAHLAQGSQGIGPQLVLSLKRVMDSLEVCRIGFPSIPLTGASPTQSVFPHPVEQSSFEPHVVAGFLGLDPLVSQYFIAFREKFAI